MRWPCKMKIKFIYATFKNLYFYSMKLITKFRWLFLAAALFITSQAKSQQVVLEIDSSFFKSFPSSLPLDTVFPDTVKVRNIGNGIFNGYLSFEISVNGGAGFAFTGTAGVSVDFNDSIILSHNDSVSIAVHVYVDTPEFAAGPSVVVIWPICNGISPGDSIEIDTLQDNDTIQVLPIIAGITAPFPSGLKVYTQADQLFIQCSEPNALKHVRIFDVAGSLVMEQDLSASNTIPMGKYSEGIYLAELILNSGDKITYKVFSGR